MVLDKERVRKVLRDTVLALCQTMEYNAEMCVEGLLGITVDHEEVILVNIHEVLRSDLPRDLSMGKSSEKRKVESDIVNNNTLHSFSSVDDHVKKKLRPSCLDSTDSFKMFPFGKELPEISHGSLRMPIIPPEHRFFKLPLRERRKQISNVAEQHIVISNMLGSNNKYPQKRPSSFDLFESSSGLDLVKKELDGEFQDINLPKETDNNNSKFITSANHFSKKNTLTANHSQQACRTSSLHSAATDTKFIPISSELTSTAGEMVAMPVFSQSYHQPIISPASQHGSTSSSCSSATPQPIGIVVDSNVQPPAPIGVLAGPGGMLQPFDVTKTSPISATSTSTKTSSSLLNTTPGKDQLVSSIDSYLSPGVNSMNKGTVIAQSENKPLIKGKEFRRFRCTLCPASSSRKFNLQRHMKSHHPGYGENYILDLTPKERGNQTMKLGEKSSSGTGFVYNDSFISTDDLSNNSDMAMDLSSPPASVGLNYPVDSPEGYSLGNSNFTKKNSSDNSGGSDFNERTDQVSTETEVYKPPPILHNMFTKIRKTENGSKAKRGLDQVLFSKFGCYTTMSNEGENNADKSSSDMSKRHPCFPVPVVSSTPENGRNQDDKNSQNDQKVPEKSENVIPVVVENNDTMEGVKPNHIDSYPSENPSVSEFDGEKPVESDLNECETNVDNTDNVDSSKEKADMPCTTKEIIDTESNPSEENKCENQIDDKVAKLNSNLENAGKSYQEVVDYVFKNTVDEDIGNAESDLEDKMETEKNEATTDDQLVIETEELGEDLGNLDGESDEGDSVNIPDLDGSLAESEKETDTNKEQDEEKLDENLQENDDNESESSNKLLRPVKEISTDDVSKTNVSPGETRNLRVRSKSGGKST